MGNNQHVGHVDIELISASLYDKANAYASVCIKNNSMPISVSLKFYSINSQLINAIFIRLFFRLASDTRSTRLYNMFNSGAFQYQQSDLE